MVRTRSDLIVPIRDRRQSRRWVTVRTLRNAAIAIVIVFAALTLWSEFGPHRKSDGDYGRLLKTQVSRDVPVSRKAPQVIQEAQPIPDVTVADPMLIGPAARAQVLGVGTAPPPPPVVARPPEPAMPLPASSDAASARAATGGGRVVIVGGADGVSVVHTDAKRPVLQGGVFRKPN